MIKTIKFESEAWVCDCGKTWPEDIDNCTCGLGPPDYIKGENGNSDRFPYLEFNWDFPAKYEVCGCCQGRGTTTFGHTAANQIAWTQSEWAEEDSDFREDYINGHYDQPCPECNGRTTTSVIDEKKFNEEQTKWYAVWCKDRESSHYIDEIAEAERRFGC